MPNVALLSELNPRSTGAIRFNPFDPIQQYIAQYRKREINQDAAKDIFLERIDWVVKLCEEDGKAIILRDHSHGDFLLPDL